MNCKEFSNLLDAYADGALSPEEAGRMREHAAACPDCAARLTLLNDARRMEEEIEVPESFSSSWRQKIREEEKMEEKTAKKFAWKNWIAAAAVLVFVLGGTAITRDSMPARTGFKHNASQNAPVSEPAYTTGGSVMRKTADAGAPNMAYDAEVPMMMGAYDDYDVAEMEAVAEEAAPAAGAPQQEKIIRSASFTIKTNNYDADLEKLQSLTGDMGGRVEYLSANGDASSGQTRSASLTLRIPAQRLDEFLSGVEGIGNVTAMTQEMQDVSENYYDTQTRLQTQQEKLKRLQAMIASAEDVGDLIEIESAIADAQYYIDRYTSQLRSYDGKVEYSTVHATVREVKVTEMVNVTLGQRILTGLENSVEGCLEFAEDMIIFLVAALPWLIGLGVIVGIVTLIVKARRRNHKKKEG